MSCTYSHMNATYDVSPLLKVGGAYHVEDEYDTTRNYTYSMNICAAPASPAARARPGATHPSRSMRVRV